MKLGADSKKLAFLGVLVLIGAYVFYSNMTSSDAPPQSSPRPQAQTTPQQVAVAEPEPQIVAASRSARSGTSTRSTQEFRPSLKPRRAEERSDPATVDPTLRLDLLAKLQNVKVEGGLRSLFEFGQAPPKVPDPKIIPGKIRPGAPLPGGLQPGMPGAPGGAQTAFKPPPPPINLKFYGYVSPARAGAKRAFFLDGDDIFVASEGELVKRRYKIVRIGVNSVVVEDVEHKNQQTLPMMQEVGS